MKIEFEIEDSIRKIIREEMRAAIEAFQEFSGLVNENKDKYLTLSELQDYLPEHPAKQTVYGWVFNRKIPFEKHGKTLYFKKSEIDNWLDNARNINHLKID